ncbi:hypothetical protein BKA61DRAFT_698273 [Leptodontidium sp. MPI-SDFR-AT-0119]|nr:hypothetical protein BKA61DRAFT_698273 [Leptodontidium sp. MPI-SDFR-AT-0119]
MPVRNIIDFYVEDIGEPEREVDPLVTDPLLPHCPNTNELEPPISDTVGQLFPGHFALGSLMLCKSVKYGQDIPSDAICHWLDEGLTFYLQRRGCPKSDKTADGNPEVGRIRSWLQNGIWKLSENTFCKVNVWAEGMTTEYATIKWVNQHIPSLPTVEVIYHWIDVEWKRTIMISKRIPGKTYLTAWPALTTPQKLHVAAQVAGHLKSLSEWTSDYVETVEKTGAVGVFSIRERETLPAVTPRVESRVSREDYEAFMKRSNLGKGILALPPNLGEPLILHHPHCHPDNIFVTTPSGPEQMPQVTAIYDWEHVRYFPKYWVATTPRWWQDFVIGNQKEPTDEVFDWQWMLSNACVRVGFPLELDYVKECLKPKMAHFPSLSVEDLIRCDHLPSDDQDEHTEL